jgi:hypothetical protein
VWPVLLAMFIGVLLGVAFGWMAGHSADATLLQPVLRQLDDEHRRRREADALAEYYRSRCVKAEHTARPFPVHVDFDS